MQNLPNILTGNKPNRGPVAWHEKAPNHLAWPGLRNFFNNTLKAINMYQNHTDFDNPKTELLTNNPHDVTYHEAQAAGLLADLSLKGNEHDFLNALIRGAGLGEFGRQRLAKIVGDAA